MAVVSTCVNAACFSRGDNSRVTPGVIIAQLRKLFPIASEFPESLEFEEWEKKKWVLLEKIRASEEVKETLKLFSLKVLEWRKLGIVNVFMEIRKAICALAPTEVPPGVSPEFLTHLHDSISSNLKSQNGYSPPSEMDVEEPVLVKEEVRGDNLYPDLKDNDSDLGLRRSRRVPQKSDNYVKKPKARPCYPGRAVPPESNEDPVEIKNGLVCEECKISFVSYYTLKKHQRIDHQLQSLTCHRDGCKYQTFNRQHLTSHLRNAHQQIQEDPVPCPKCNKVFASKTNLKYHDWLVHLRRYNKKCEKCGLILNSASNLKYHMLKVHKIDLDADKEKFYCSEPGCGRVFSFSTALERHRKIKHSKLSKVDSCLNCGRRFWLPLALKKHTLLCTSFTDRKKCLRCDIRFVTRMALLEHNEKEHGLIVDLTRPSEPDNCEPVPDQGTNNSKTGVNCEHCGKTFYTLPLLMHHQARVHKIGDLKCDQCDEVFTSVKRCALTRHKETRHTNTNVKRATKRKRPVVKCKLCEKTFYGNETLRHHEARIHKIGDLKCDQCDEVFSRTRKLDLILHKINVHTDMELRFSKNKLKCKYCEKSFHRPALLKIHEARIHKIGDLKCDEFDEVFNTKSDSKTCPIKNPINHEEEEYKCDVANCDQIFKTKKLLSRHQRKDHESEYYFCDQCPKVYLERVQLYRHQHNFHEHRKKHKERKANEKLKTYMCNECNKKYATKFSLDRHLTGKHNQQVDLATASLCDKCEKAFPTKKQLAIHYTIKHPVVIGQQSSSSSSISTLRGSEKKGNGTEEKSEESQLVDMLYASMKQ